MALVRLKNGVEKQSDSRLLEYSNHVLTQMTGNPHFPTPSPELADVAAAITNFSNAVNQAANGDRMAVAIKNDRRNELVDLLHLLGYYVVFAAHGDRTIALSSGFPLTKEPQGQVLTQPQNFKVVSTTQTGELVSSVNRVPGSRAYLHQYTTDAAQSPGSWKTISCTTSKCHIKGLTPGTTYYLRVGAVGSRDQVMYSEILTKMAS